MEVNNLNFMTAESLFSAGYNDIKAIRFSGLTSEALHCMENVAGMVKTIAQLFNIMPYFPVLHNWSLI